MKVMNAHMPRRRRTLFDLQQETHPHVMCNDGNAHYFRKDELEKLASLLSEDEQRVLLLPIIMEVTSSKGEIIIRTKGGPEEKVFAAILGMPVTCRQQQITLFRPQLTVLRKTLKTTTQYMFTVSRDG